jgi:hypothetical protein
LRSFVLVDPLRSFRQRSLAVIRTGRSLAVIQAAIPCGRPHRPILAVIHTVNRSHLMWPTKI